MKRQNQTDPEIPESRFPEERNSVEIRKSGNSRVET